MTKKHLETLILGVVVLLVITGSLFTAQDTDRDIESNFQKTYAFQNFFKDDEINISARNGVVTLTGTVNDESHIAMAEDIIRDMKGVKRVDNQLRVSGQNYERNSDMWIKSRINSMLSLRSNIDLDNTHVEVRDGRVTLHGEASSNEAKRMLTDRIREMEGVKDVDNQMTIASSLKQPKSVRMDDSSIRAQANVALLYCGFSGSAMGTTGKTGYETSGTTGKTGYETSGTTGKTGYETGTTGTTGTTGKTGTTGTSGTMGTTGTTRTTGTSATGYGISNTKPEIKIKNGVATVTGSAENSSEKERVTRCLENLHGVKKVDNRMSIGSFGQSSQPGQTEKPRKGN